MKTSSLLRSKTLIFKHWTRKPFAVFNSLHKKVKISCITASYGLLSISLPSFAQQDTVNTHQNIDLKEVEVVGDKNPDLYTISGRQVEIISGDQLKSLTGRTIQEVLEYALNVDIRQRGGFGTQADVNIRGGSFDQVLVLLNGANVTDPQTGHYSLNLPIDPLSITRIEILNGPGSRVYGAGAFTGVINIITSPRETNSSRVHISGGQHNWNKEYVDINLNLLNFSNNLSISHNGSGGYAKNTDLTSNTIFYQGHFQYASNSMDINAGYGEKWFGANSFYTPSFPYQFDANKVIFTNVKMKTGEKVVFMPQIYWKRHLDRFELLREGEEYYLPTPSGWVNRLEDDTISWYKDHNYHMTDVTGAKFNMSFQSVLGSTTMGLEYRNERIYSTNLGEPDDSVKAIKEESGKYYNKSYTRSNLSIMLEQSYKYNNFIITAGGILGTYDLQENDMVFLPGIDLGYFPGKGNLKLRASWNEAYRLPTFTDLFIASGGNFGNTDLKPEKSQTREFGIDYKSHFIDFSISVFNRIGKDIIDYVFLDTTTATKFQADTLNAYKAFNITDLNTSGIEVTAKIPFNAFLSEQDPGFIKLNYSWLTVNKTEEDFKSKYALDYLKHKADLMIHHRVIGKIFSDWNMSYQERAGTFQYLNTDGNVVSKPYGEHLLMDLRLSWIDEKYTAFAEISNLFDEKFVDAGSMQQPGRWFRAGVQINIDL